MLPWEEQSVSGWDCLSRSFVSPVGEGLGLAAGAAVCLSKPVGIKRVVQVIEGQLAR
jgi:hypothetical protein